MCSLRLHASRSFLITNEECIDAYNNRNNDRANFSNWVFATDDFGSRALDDIVLLPHSDQLSVRHVTYLCAHLIMKRVIMQLLVTAGNGPRSIFLFFIASLIHFLP